MALKFTTTKIKYYCPHCGSLLKKQVNDDSLSFIYIFLFIPIGLIVLIAKLINKAIKPKKAFTIFGEEILLCPNCNNYIAISTYPNLPHSRVLSAEDMIINHIEPHIAPHKIENRMPNCSKCKYNINESTCEIWRQKPTDKCDEFKIKNNCKTKNDFINS